MLHVGPLEFILGLLEGSAGGLPFPWACENSVYDAWSKLPVIGSFDNYDQPPSWALIIIIIVVVVANTY